MSEPKCETCLHFTGCDVDDPDDFTGKCPFDEIDADGYSQWRDRNDSCERWVFHAHVWEPLEGDPDFQWICRGCGCRTSVDKSAVAVSPPVANRRGGLKP